MQHVMDVLVVHLGLVQIAMYALEINLFVFEELSILLLANVIVHLTEHQELIAGTKIKISK